MTEDQSGGISYSFNKPLIADGKLPMSRNGSSVVFADNKLVVFGGTFTETEGKFSYLNETWLLDCATLHWHKMNCSGQPPGPRYNHTAQIVGSRMFVFGGRGPNGIYNDIFFLDLVEWTWVPILTLAAIPSARLHHASTLVGKKIVIHGGWDGESKIFDDLWIFNTDSFSWMQPKTTGFAPGARYGHSMTFTPNGKIIVFGGCSMSEKIRGVPNYNNDLRILDTEVMIWLRPKAAGLAPTGRYAHSSCLIDNNSKIVLFGGWGTGGCQTKDMINNQMANSIHIFDFHAVRWCLPSYNIKKPIKHLFNHGCVSAAGTNSLLVFGGSDGRQSVNDFMVINFDFPSSAPITSQDNIYDYNENDDANIDSQMMNLNEESIS